MIEIIPAIDLIEGKCVRLSQGDYGRKQEYGDPLDMAMKFEDHGIGRLHLVDLDGAREKRLVNYRILENIAARTGLVIDAGGGLRTLEDARIAFESGAHMVTGGSIAVKDRREFISWLKTYGPERIILGADFRDGKIAVSGWYEKTSLDLMEFITSYRKEGIKMAICTDIQKDGMLEGPSMETYRQIRKEHKPLHLIASGGISGMKDIEELEEAGIGGVIVGKAIYEGRISLQTLESFIINRT
ncbi:MAG: 1-(5-phosphoribosyl)-5-[(5-phosphoribosylamino)methylideneamino]imidazole-4-carboxamide isomerase [Bacteroidota bacterium]